MNLSSSVIVRKVEERADLVEAHDTDAVPRLDAIVLKAAHELSDKCPGLSG